jgi:hypothetical protein
MTSRKVNHFQKILLDQAVVEAVLLQEYLSKERKKEKDNFSN